MLSRRLPTGAAAWSGNAKPLMTMQLAESVAARALALSALALGSVGAQAQAAGAVDPQAEQSLEEIVVTATRGEKPLIEVPPSVTTQQTEELRLKGDGMPFIGPDEEVLLYEVPYPVVDTVEIVRGPVSALYGRDSIAGALNYRTHEISRNSNDLRLSSGTADFQRASGSLERSFDNGASLLVSAAYEDFGGWRDSSRRELPNILVKDIVPVSERGELIGWSTHYDRESEVPSVIPTLGDGSIVDVHGEDDAFFGYLPTRNHSEGLIAAGRYDHRLSESLSLSVTGQTRSFDSDARLNFSDLFEFNPASITFSSAGPGPCLPT